MTFFLLMYSYSPINDTYKVHAWTSKKKALDKHHQYMYALSKSQSSVEFFNHHHHHYFHFVTYWILHKGRIESILLFFCFFTTVFNIYRRENWLNKIMALYYCLFTGVCMLNEWNWIINRPPLLFSYNYSVEKEKLLTSYDFTSSVKIDWNKTIIGYICISFNRLYWMYIFIWE
jgi:hypothetical protein